MRPEQETVANTKTPASLDTTIEKKNTEKALSGETLNIQNVAERINYGESGCVTLTGMGGVFFALVLLFLFIKVLDKGRNLRSWFKKKSSSRWTRDQVKPTTDSSENSSVPVKPNPIAPDQAGEELAAAAAVAIACALQQRQTAQPLSLPTATHFESNAWRTSGRLGLMNHDLTHSRSSPRSHSSE